MTSFWRLKEHIGPAEGLFCLRMLCNAPLGDGEALTPSRPIMH